MASNEEKPTNGKPKQKAKPDKKPKCGIVMPISEMDGYTTQHWADVREILFEVARSAELDVSLVSNTDEVTVIHKTIIQNLYSNEIVICDVSGRNPNVMFELGMRLTFDKPTIIIKDDITDFSFDTGVIEHLPYPRDLRYQTIVDFKEILKSKLSATLKKAGSDKNYSPFLKHFGVHTVTGLQTQELTPEKYIIEAVSDLTKDMRILRNEVSRITLNAQPGSVRVLLGGRKLVFFTSEGPDDAKWNSFHRAITKVFPDLEGTSWPEGHDNKWNIVCEFTNPKSIADARIIEGHIKRAGVEVNLDEIT